MLSGRSARFECPRAVRRNGHRYARQIDYRHLVENLKRKPGAFARWVFRDDIFPRMIYRQTWESLSAKLPERRPARPSSACWHWPPTATKPTLANDLEQLHARQRTTESRGADAAACAAPELDSLRCRDAADAGIVRRASGNGVMSGAQINADGRLGMMLTELRLPTIKRLASEVVRPIRSRRLAGAAIAGTAARTRDERTRSSALRAASHCFGS